ncbi:MAG: efflux RND transporter periplasmic adaptor subunit [Alphaproteobacteria bacterium]|nr:efflux RND transporter periplasmic adaptor subunit [Alphaproteobacteria bacterium]
MPADTIHHPLEDLPRLSEPAPKDTRLRGLIQVGLVAGTLAAGLGLNAILSTGSSAPQIKSAGPAVLSVQVIRPEAQASPLKVSEHGTVEVRNAIELSPQIAGRVVYVSPNLASGGSFKAGEVLFRIDDADIRAELSRARAEVSAAQADLLVERAEAELARREWAMVNPGQAIPPLVAREPQTVRAEAAVEVAEAALADAQLRLSRVEVRMPFDGRVLATSVEVGQTLNAGQSYGRVYNQQDLEISLAVTARALAALDPAVGRQAVVQRQGQTDGIPASVSRVDANLDPQTRLARLVLTPNSDAGLLPGEFIEADIIGPVFENAFRLPERTLSENLTVWVVENGALAPRLPDILSIEDDLLATEPFDTAEGVVVSPLIDPHPGTPVKIVGQYAAKGTTL